MAKWVYVISPIYNAPFMFYTILKQANPNNKDFHSVNEVMKGTPRHIFQKVVKSTKNNFTGAKSNNIMFFLTFQVCKKAFLFFQASWTVSPFLASLELARNTFCED